MEEVRKYNYYLFLLNANKIKELMRPNISIISSNVQVDSNK